MPFDAAPSPKYTLYRQQHTLAREVVLSGIGVHSAAQVNLKIEPAAPGAGIQFIRSDVAENNVIPANYDSVSNTQFCTVLENAHGVSVSTVEHVMAALRGLGIDNAVVTVDGPEMPIMDGSSAPFIAAMDAVGTVEQNAPRDVLRILRPVRVENGSAFASIEPGRASEFGFQIDYPGTAIGTQRFEVTLVNGNFRHDIAGARTFGLKEDVTRLHAMGLGKGGSLENAIVVDGEEILNDDGLRFNDEFVRHKVLDAIGDMYLAGAPILGRYIGHRAGHTLNNQLLRAVFADARNYTFESVASLAA
jgi:UDP-3-O-[3-hydroxymyristoyl] N-acetylglucosamine deacetylase